MNKHLILTQPTAVDELNTTVTSTTNENDNFSIDITEVELDELLTDEFFL